MPLQQSRQSYQYITPVLRNHLKSQLENETIQNDYNLVQPGIIFRSNSCYHRHHLCHHHHLSSSSLILPWILIYILALSIIIEPSIFYLLSQHACISSIIYHAPIIYHASLYAPIIYHASLYAPIMYASHLSSIMPIQIILSLSWLQESNLSHWSRTSRTRFNR